MLRIAVYRPDSMPAFQKDALADAAIVVAQHTGVNKLRFSWSSGFEVEKQPAPTIDFLKNFHSYIADHAVHLIAAPLGWEGANIGGIAAYGEGVAAVDVNDATDANVLWTATAHELAHSLGFVRGGSAQDVDIDNHCRDESCIMRPSATLSHESVGIDACFNMVRTRLLRQNVVPRTEGPPTAFCSPCQLDLAEYGQTAVANLQALRDLSV